MSRTTAPASQAPAPLEASPPVDLATRRAAASMPDVRAEGVRDFLRATLDSLSSHVAVLDEDGTVLLTNAGWERFAAENGGGPTVGSDYLGVCDAATDDPYAAEAARGIRAILAGEILQAEVEYPCHAVDEQCWFRLRAVRHRALGPVRVVVQHDDITARRKAEEDARVRASVLDVADAAVVALDRTGRVTRWSDGAQRLYGWTADEVIDRPITDLLLGDVALAEIRTIIARIHRTGYHESRFDVMGLAADPQSVGVLPPDPGLQIGEFPLAARGFGSALLDRELRQAGEAQHLVGALVAKRVAAFDQGADDGGQGVEVSGAHSPGLLGARQARELVDDLPSPNLRDRRLRNQERRHRLSRRSKGMAVVVGLRSGKRSFRASLPGRGRRKLEQVREVLLTPAAGGQPLPAFCAPAQQVTQDLRTARGTGRSRGILQK